VTRFNDIESALDEIAFLVADTGETHCIVRSHGYTMTVQPYNKVKRFPNRIMATMGSNNASRQA
jgi:hypothetical protein